MADRLIVTCARALNTQPDALSDASGPGSVTAWDSLGTMSLVAEMEEEFGVRLSLSSVARIQSIADLRAALREKGVTDV